MTSVGFAKAGQVVEKLQSCLVENQTETTKTTEIARKECCYTHPDLYKTLCEYRIVRRAGYFDPVSYNLLHEIYSTLVKIGHSKAHKLEVWMNQLPKGGMMMNLEEWDWLFTFLDKLAVSNIARDCK